MNKYIGWLILFTCLFQACEVDTVKKGWIERPAPRAVLNAILSPDSIIRVTVSRTTSGMLDNMDEEDYMKRIYINDAVVEVWLNGQSRGIMRLEEGKNGLYSLPGLSVSAGDRIEMKASTPQYGMISSEAIVPSPLEGASLDTTLQHTPGQSSGYSKMDIRLALQDRPGERNYYLVSFLPTALLKKNDSIICLDTIGYGAFIWNSIFPASEEKVKEVPFGYGYLYYLANAAYGPGYGYGYNWGYGGSQHFLFTDEGCDGEPINLDFDLDYFRHSYKNDSINCMHTCHVILSAISESYYLYCYSLIQRKEQDDVLGDFGLREPIPIYTNVKGGYGILSARQEKSYDIVLPYGSEPCFHYP